MGCVLALLTLATRALTTGPKQTLAALVDASGLGRDTVPQDLPADRMASVALAENQLRVLLDPAAVAVR